MRWLAVVPVLASLSVPTLGQGHSGTISIEHNGSNTIDITDVNAGPFYVDIMVSSSDPLGMCAFQVTLTGPSSLVVSPPLDFYGMLLNYAGEFAQHAPRPGFADLNWGMDATQGYAEPFFGGPLPQAGPPYDQVGAINRFPLWGQNGWAAWVELSGTAQVGDVIGGTGAVVGDSEFQDTEVTLIPLVITPEPASALLLLAGAPLLRRRR